jgi:hypothetical protein
MSIAQKDYMLQRISWPNLDYASEEGLPISPSRRA